METGQTQEGPGASSGRTELQISVRNPASRQKMDDDTIICFWPSQAHVHTHERTHTLTFQKLSEACHDPSTIP